MENQQARPHPDSQKIITHDDRATTIVYHREKIRLTNNVLFTELLAKEIGAVREALKGEGLKRSRDLFRLTCRAKLFCEILSQAQISVQPQLRQLLADLLKLVCQDGNAKTGGETLDDLLE